MMQSALLRLGSRLHCEGHVEMDGGKLILFVQQYEELYNFKNHNYSNVQRREIIWEEIGQLMKQPGHLCRERWKRLRDNHSKALRLRKTKSGQAASKMKAPKFEKELTFLVPYIFDEETRQSNISPPSTLSQDEQSNDDMDSHGTADNNDTAHSSITDTTAPSSPRASTDCVQQERRKRTHSPEEPSAASVLQEYLRSKKKNQPSSEDTLTNFFISMAQTVKTFPLRDQIEIKGKLFQMVNATEMKIALMNPSSSEITNNCCHPDYHAQDSGDLQKYCQSAP